MIGKLSQPRQHGTGCLCSDLGRIRPPTSMLIQGGHRFRTAPLQVRCSHRGSASRQAPQRPSVFAQYLMQGSQAAAAVALSAMLFSGCAWARWEGVNKPELLPKEFSKVIDVAGFLTAGEEQRIKAEVDSLERDKGIKLRVLAQNYPETPGLAVKDYWQVDDMTIVFVADTNTGNLLNFNVGSSVDLLVPRNFWGRLAGKFGNKFYWQDRGQGEAITNTVSAIDFCAREPAGRSQCSKIQGDLDEQPSSGKLGKFFFNS